MPFQISKISIKSEDNSAISKCSANVPFLYLSSKYWCTLGREKGVDSKSADSI
jgi:hypothetical protein